MKGGVNYCFSSIGIKMIAFSPLSVMVLRVFLAVVLLAAIVLALTNLGAFDAVAVEAWVNDAGLVGPVLFMLIYALGTVLMVPGPIFVLMGGALYGPVYGTFYSLTGVMIGSAVAFFIARFIVADWLEQKIGGRLRRLKEGVEQEGWRFVAFLRLVPVFPAIVLNYALGLTRIKFSHYFIASYICKLPSVAAYAYVGHVGLEAMSDGEDLVPKVLIVVSLAGFVIFLPRLIVNLRRDPPMSIGELNTKIHAGEEILVLDVRTEEDLVGPQDSISGAKNIPLDDLEQRLDELAYYTERPIALLSRTEKLSYKAAEILVSNGFAHVRVVILNES